MITLNRKTFWNQYRADFADKRTLTQPEVDGVNFFLDKFEKETRLKLISEYSYVLATAYHESGKIQTIEGKKALVRFQPVREARERSDSPRRTNQDKYWKTGYFGRGYVQTTHKENYLKSGAVLGLGDLFIVNPDLLLQPGYAYDSMIICMVKGLYTGHKLSEYFTAAKTEYEGARRIVNGTDKVNLIAGYAEDFQRIIKNSLSPATDTGLSVPGNPSPSRAENAAGPTAAAGAESSAADTDTGTEKTITATKETESGNITAKSTQLNQQDVNAAADVTEPKPQGFKAKLIAGIAFLTGSTVIYDAVGKVAGITFTTQTIIIFCFIAFLAFLGFCVWAVLQTWKSNSRTHTEAMANTDINRRNVNWVKPE